MQNGTQLTQVLGCPKSPYVSIDRTTLLIDFSFFHLYGNQPSLLQSILFDFSGRETMLQTQQQLFISVQEKLTLYGTLLLVVQQWILNPYVINGGTYLPYHLFLIAKFLHLAALQHRLVLLDGVKLSKLLHYLKIAAFRNLLMFIALHFQASS